MTRKSIFVVVAVLVLGVGLFVLSGRRQSDSGAASQTTAPATAIIGTSTGVGAALVWIAEDKGYFREEGVAPVLKEFSFGKAATDALVAGEVDFSTVAEYVVAKMGFAHDDLRAVGTISINHDIEIVARRASGIASATDLKDKKVGVTMGSASEFLLSRLLTLNGLTSTDIEWVNLGPNDMSGALDRGEVDAVIIWQPHVTQIHEALGDKVVSFDGQPGQDYYFLLVGTSGWLDGNGETTGKILKALGRAEAWLQTNPDEARAYLITKFQLSEALMDANTKSNRLSLTLPRSLTAALNVEGQWLEEGGKVEGVRPTDYSTLIDSEPLRRVKPMAVTVDR